MSIYQVLENTPDISPIRAVHFSVSSPQEIVRRSVCEITTHETFDGDIPKVGGLYDPRMGVIDRGKKCPTDEQDHLNCPGYFGHIELAMPVFHYQFIKYTMKVLKCVCVRCSKLLISSGENDMKRIIASKKGVNRFLAVHALCSKVKACGERNDNGCGMTVPDIIKRHQSQVGKLVAEWKLAETNEQEWNAEDVHRILRLISDDDCEAMGFSRKFCRPDWLICTVLAVPPPTVRPSVRESGGTRREDDLTHKLGDIIRTNKALKLKLSQYQKAKAGIIEKTNGRPPLKAEAQKKVIDEWYQLLQFHVGTFVNNKLPGVPQAQQRTGRPLKSIQDRIKAKEGRVRGNLMGKRVDYSARSVITPDPRLQVGELGVPIDIAMDLTHPEVVNRFNKARMLGYVRNGYSKYPGAKSIKRISDGELISLSVIDPSTIELNIGDIVNRHIINGDAILFNRQPSLHKMSMMCHRARVLPYKTFRLNPSVTTPYNADFDGDEMNAHVPQSEATVAEIMTLAGVATQIITPAQHKPIIGIVQDPLVGSYLFTKYDNYLTRSQVLDITADIKEFNGELPNPEVPAGTPESSLPPWFPKYKYSLKANAKGVYSVPQDLWSGRQIFSIILPKVTMKKPNNSYSRRKEHNMVVIKNGVLEEGVLDKSLLGQAEKALIHVIYNDFGMERCERFLNDVQSLVNNWIMKSGFSVGIGDLIPDPTSKTLMTTLIAEHKQKVVGIINEVRQGILENNSGKSLADEFELRVTGALNGAIDGSGKIAQMNLLSDNRFMAMINSGSKGSVTNVGQIIACLGQQSVDGKRIPYGFTDRTLPHFHKYDDGASARGFVESSFMAGLTPTEFFFHAMGGREGLIDTAVKSVTGDTPIIIIENGNTKYVKIGEWIDNLLDCYSDNVRHFAERQMELLDLYEDHKVYIPTTDEKGRVSWGEISAVTRHDPGTELYQITTQGGRSVIVTESKSLLIWKDDIKEFQEILTPEIKIGDYVPTTMNLPEPSIITPYIDMTNYFPKSTYLYGGEYHKAISSMKVAMINRCKINSGWWNRNNNITFTLPYSNKARLQRSMIRSNLENIKEGFIYPYSANRTCGRIPEKFELNYENGILIGLYLSEGHVCEDNGTLNITNNDENVHKFLINWYSKYNINTAIIRKINNIGGTTTTVVAYSTILGRFMKQIAGHLSMNKFVPSDVFTASNDCIIGVLNGYVSGDGHISSNSIETSSASQRLTEGISMLCSRLGIFSKVFITQNKHNNLNTANILPSYRLSIRAQWANKFAELVPLLVNYKQDALKALDCKSSHINFPILNDVVMDKIIEIKLVDISNYPKVYDLTIPSTLNFGLANGLQVRDTSETGYIQRRLVKGLEDARVATDYSVRNANGTIIQFIYGEDGFNGAKIESIKLPTLNMPLETLNADYDYPDKYDWEKNYNPLVVASIKSMEAGRFRAIMTAHLEQLRADKDYIRRELVYMLDKDEKLFSPVPFERLLDNAKTLFVTPSQQSDLDPVYALDQINKTIEKMTVTRKGTIAALLRAYLSPRAIQDKYQMNRVGFDYIIGHTLQLYYGALVSPGESVGTIAAQSIGEPSTQMTLNTFHMAGVASKSQVTRGVPRFKELLSVSPSIKGPQATIVLKPAYSSDQDKAQMVMNKITITTIRQLVQSSEVYYKSGGLEREFQVAEGFCEPLAGEKTLSPWVLKISFDKRKMLDKGIEMTDIYFAVISQFNIEQEDVRCLFTDDNSQSLVLCIQCILDKTEDADGEDDDMINILKTMEKTILNDISLTGIRNIKSAFLDKDKTNMVYDAATGNYKTQERWVIKTIGTNLADILADPRVDAYCTFSNDVVEIYQTLGIEAARQALMKEIKEVFEDAGSYINLRHIMLLADVMTNRGYLMPMDRHGINKSDRGPLAKCSFEETADVIARAAIFGELDRLNGVSANIMLGQEVPIGTGSVDIVFDEEMYEKWSLAMETDETGETPALEVKTIDPVRQVFMNQYCTLENLDMGI